MPLKTAQAACKDKASPASVPLCASYPGFPRPFISLLEWGGSLAWIAKALWYSWSKEGKYSVSLMQAPERPGGPGPSHFPLRWLHVTVCVSRVLPLPLASMA